MEVKHIPKSTLTYDPYEEDVCGSHDGEALEIKCGDDIIIRIQQSGSGIGSSWRVTATHPTSLKPTCKLETYVDDDGVFVTSVGALNVDMVNKLTN